MSDKDQIGLLLNEAWGVGKLDDAQARAAKKLLDFDGEKYPSDGCAITLSVLLQDAGIDVLDIYTAIQLGRELRDTRGWQLIDVGSQQAGDVGSTCGQIAVHGKDHIYLVLQNLNVDEMIIADNQSAKPHFRFASGQGGKTPTRFFLRAPGAAFGPFIEKLDAEIDAAPVFPSSAPFSGVADLYENNTWNAQTLWNAGVRMVFHKMGQWKDDSIAANKTIYAKRKKEWLALGGVWAAYYLPHAQGTSDGHLAHMDACDPDARIYRAIDWEPQSDGGPIASRATISALANLIFQRYGRSPLKYGSRSTLDYGNDPVLDQCENWFADPNDCSLPTSFTPNRPPAGLTPLWQWTKDGDAIVAKFDGIDFSAFNGTEDELLAKFKIV